MAKRLTPAIEEKIKLFSQQRSELISEGGPILHPKNVMPKYKTHANNIGPFVLEKICKLGMQPEIKTNSRKNVTKAHPYEADHVERSEKAVQTDPDIKASDTRSDSDLAIETPNSTVSSVVFEIGTVEKLSLKDRRSSLFQTRLHRG